MAVVDADYATVIGYCRTRLGNGTRLNAAEMIKTIAVVQNSVSRMTTGNTAQNAVITSLTAVKTALLALDATACVADLGVTAAAVVVTQCAAIDTALAAILAGEPAVPTYTSSVGLDG